MAQGGRVNLNVQNMVRRCQWIDLFLIHGISCGAVAEVHVLNAPRGRRLSVAQPDCVGAFASTAESFLSANASPINARDAREVDDERTLPGTKVLNGRAPGGQRIDIAILIMHHARCLHCA